MVFLRCQPSGYRFPVPMRSLCIRYDFSAGYSAYSAYTRPPFSQQPSGAGIAWQHSLFQPVYTHFLPEQNVGGIGYGSAAAQLSALAAADSGRLLPCFTAGKTVLRKEIRRLDLKIKDSL